MAREKTKKEKVGKVIVYYPELRKVISTLGFDNSTQVFSFLRKCNVDFVYERIYTKEHLIDATIKDLRRLTTEIEIFDKGFIFVMDVPNTDAVEVVHCLFFNFPTTKEILIKFLQLKVFA